MSVALRSETGEEHGMIGETANSCEDNGFKHMTPENKAKCEKMKKEDHRIVKARYINHRGMHERLSMTYCRWGGDRLQKWHFIPGNTYEVPMGLVNQVNDPNKKLPRRSDLLDARGMPTQKEGMAETIHEMVPIDFK